MGFWELTEYSGSTGYKLKKIILKGLTCKTLKITTNVVTIKQQTDSVTTVRKTIGDWTPFPDVLLVLSTG